MTASICRAESCVDFADFTRDRASLFGDFLEPEGGLPSQDTFSRLFRLLDPTSFARCFGRFLDHLGGVGVGVVDGKIRRPSFDTAAQQSPPHVVTTFACERRLVVAQATVNGKENEILAARIVLELFDIRGMMITVDVLHCNAKTTRLILGRGGDHLIALKGNPLAMHKDVRELFAQPPSPPQSHVTVANDHGRLETRRQEVWHDVAWLNPTRSQSDEARLPGVAMIGMIEMVIEQAGKTRCERRYFVSSRQLSAAEFAKTACAHWKIKYSLHWVPDICFDEDRARNRRDDGPQNLATLRKLALTVL